jgi:hypothetical protein
VFFLGLLSTPLPYLLLAAFYFFGFAMGMFNNSTGDEPAEVVAAVTIPVEVRQKTTEPSTFYFQVQPDQVHFQATSLTPEKNISSFFPDTGSPSYLVTNDKVPGYLYSGFQFSRPPPFAC